MSNGKKKGWLNNTEIMQTQEYMFRLWHTFRLGNVKGDKQLAVRIMDLLFFYVFSLISSPQIPSCLSIPQCPN